MLLVNSLLVSTSTYLRVCSQWYMWVPSTYWAKRPGHCFCIGHYTDVIMTTMPSQITSLTIVYSTDYSDADQRKLQSSASLAFVWGIHRDRWIPRTKGQLRGKWFHLMPTSSWFLRLHLHPQTHPNSFPVRLRYQVSTCKQNCGKTARVLQTSIIELYKSFRELQK